MTFLNQFKRFLYFRRVSLLATADADQMSEGELRVLHNLAAGVNAGLDVVEIGTYRGNSTISLARGAAAGNRVRVYAIDPHVPYIGPKGGGIWRCRSGGRIPQCHETWGRRVGGGRLPTESNGSQSVD